MATGCAAEVHLLDIGTVYRVRVLDNCLPYDPSDAFIRRLIFSLPGGVVLVKDADAVVPDGSPATAWYLEYQVKPQDGEEGSPPGEFHARTGRVKVQAYLEWTDGSRFSSSVQTHDIDGRELRIYPNLAEANLAP